MMRHHIESLHVITYNKWCTKHNFKSKLLKAVQLKKDDIAATLYKQQSLGPHFSKVEPTKHILPYSDAIFRDTTV
ncbi:hypothetical protein BYT27DRAFT_7258758 [Phlegmacium glaucopus]|nr:hypothetical protein BYT27DRAFT_7258758 [Phlegmacium glaucopus]